MQINIRSEAPADELAIEAVIVAAFRDVPYSSQTEPLIVRALRNANQLSISLVAEVDGAIVGHLAISAVEITDGSPGWLGLGPISVTPDYQRQGIGTLLMQQAIDAMKQQGSSGCVLLGDPNYYRRFGFRHEPGLLLPGVPAEYFQAISFGSKMAEGVVSYHPAFDAQSE